MNDQTKNTNENGAPVGQPAPAGYPAPRAYDVHYHYYYEPPRYTKRKSSKPTIAGVLLIITAILGLIAGVAMVGLGGMGFDMFYEDQEGDVYGTITYQNGTGAANVTVSIEGEDLSTQTDNDGYYAIHNVPSGNHEIKVEKNGYNTIIYKTFVSPSDFNIEDPENGDNQHDVDQEENEIDFILTPGNEELERGSSPPWNLIEGFLVICGTLIVIFSLFAMLGAIQALRRKSWKMALLGSILGLFTIVGSLFAFIALLITALSREEFNGGKQEQP